MENVKEGPNGNVLECVRPFNIFGLVFAILFVVSGNETIIVFDELFIKSHIYIYIRQISYVIVLYHEIYFKFLP